MLKIQKKIIFSKFYQSLKNQFSKLHQIVFFIMTYNALLLWQSFQFYCLIVSNMLLQIQQIRFEINTYKLHQQAIFMLQDGMVYSLYELTFPKVHSKSSKNDDHAQLIFKLMLEYAKSNQCLLGKSDKKEIFSKLTKARTSCQDERQSMRIKYMCKYGCAIKIIKEKRQSAISIQLIYPEEWGTGSSDWQAEKLQFMEPKNQAIVYVPSLEQYNLEIKVFLVQFEDNLQAQLRNIKNRRNKAKDRQEDNFTATQIQQACKLAMSNHYRQLINIKSKYRIEEEKEESKSLQSHKTLGESINLNQSDANTAWYVTRAVVLRLIGREGNQKYLGSKFLIGFKGYILQKATQLKLKNKQCKQEEISKFKLALDEIIYEYKHEVSRQTKKFKEFIDLTEKIEKNIINIKGGQLTTSIPDSKAEDKKYQIQHRQATMVYPQKIDHKFQKIELVKIQDFPLKVSQRVPFQGLLDIYNSFEKTEDNQSKTNKWILLTERTIFKMAEKFSNNVHLIDPFIHMREIQCEIGMSTMCEVITKYEELINKKGYYYGMLLEGQSLSHQHLIRAICSVLAFESVKYHREYKKSNLAAYRIPLDLEFFYNQFISNSYQARKALKHLKIYYDHRKDRKMLFQLKENTTSFYQFARQVARQTRSCIVWTQAMNMMLQKQRQLTKTTMQLNHARKQIEHALYVFPRYPTYLEQCRKQVLEYSLNHTFERPICNFPQQNPEIFSFLNNIPSDILGLIKILFLSQNPIKPEKEINQDKNIMFINKLFPGEDFPIKIECIRPYGTQTINSSQLKDIKDIQCLYPQNKAQLLFGDCRDGNGYTDKMFHRQVEDYYKKINDNQEEANKEINVDYYKNVQKQICQFLYPSDDKNYSRQHSIYANQNLMPEDTEIQNFLASCNVRSAENTQLTVLCANILERKIISNSYHQVFLLAERIILQAGGRISAYHKNTELHFGKIRKLLRQFMNRWKFTDTGFAPIIAPFLAFMAIQLQNDQILAQEQSQEFNNVYYQISKKCYQEFQRGEKQLLEKPELKIQWQQRFNCMAAISCYRQIILSDHDQEQIMFLAQRIFQLRSSKILSDRQEKPLNKRAFEIQLEYFVEKAIYRNIQVLSNFFLGNFENLNKLVLKMDHSFPLDTKWQKQNMVSFMGRSDSSLDVYQLNLQKGCIYKNGKEISAIDPKIKENPNYIQIFGKDRQFQVFPSHEPHFVRTKNLFNYQFKINQYLGKIVFEFSEDGTQIRHIICTQKQKIRSQEIWTLIPRKQLAKANCWIPKLFFDNYFAWYSQKRKCIVFRKKKFQQIYEIGITINLQMGRIPKIVQANYITYHQTYENQNLDAICDPENVIYDEIILRNKQIKLENIEIFSLLSRFQSPEYVFELKNKKTEEIYYLLHRYQIKFRIDPKGSMLISETFYGYALDHSFYQLKNNIFNYFPCLVLKKYLDSPSIFNNHQRILILSEGKIKKSGQIIKSKQSSKHLVSYKYDIHDLFGDIRGSNRESLLHLALIMISINDNIQIESLQMTSLQYAFHLIKSCFSNRPLSKKETQILQNILQFGTIEIMLLCKTLWTISIKLTNILPFDKIEARDPFCSIQNQILTCKTLYQKKHNSDILKFREKIHQNMLYFIGLDLQDHKISSSKQSSPQIQQLVEESSQSSAQFSDKIEYWKGLQKYQGKEIISQIKAVNEQYKSFCKNASNLNIWNNKNQKNNTPQQFPAQLSNLKKHHKDDLMIAEMINELQLSYQTFMAQQDRIEVISESFKNAKKVDYTNKVKQLKITAKTLIQKIEVIIEEVKNKNKRHPDVIIGIIPTLSQCMYTSILCNKTQIYHYYPHMDPQAARYLKTAMKIWLELKTRYFSFQRIENILEQKKVDIVALMRQVLSPRQEVFKKQSWLCFQAEMKVQLWPSQLQTYNNLMNAQKSGAFCQLNMGEGKTQVIIPLMILYTIYQKKDSEKWLPRINLLSSLFEQARANFFKFLSVTGFQIPGFQIPFNRTVDLNRQNIYAIRNVVDSFSNKLYILMTRQSRLSETLRFHQMGLKDKTIRQHNLPIIKNNIFDVFDEIDAMMNPKKSYIFSIGDQVELNSCYMRLQILRLCLEIFLTHELEDILHQKLAVSDEKIEDALEEIRTGRYPIGLRLTLQNADQKTILSLRSKLAHQIMFASGRHQYSFVKFLKQGQAQELIQYVINPVKNQKLIPSFINDASKPQIFLLRGALAYGIFEHCLSMRCGVDFGAPNHLHIKKIAVPYEAADIPSKTSEYQQPDVSGLLSYISYYTLGLTIIQFQECLSNLLTMSTTFKEKEYVEWLDISKHQERNQFMLQGINQINFNSKVHREILFQKFKKNRKTIGFWLNKCVFPRDLKQYERSICSSAWDIADVNKSVGFSGTKDNRWLYSNKLYWKPCQTPTIKGTDGKMVHLITKYTKQVCLIHENEKTLWQRFVELALKKKVGCIIDAGAICVGKSLKTEIVPWIADHEEFERQKYLGISFCDNNGRWLVYDIQSKFYIPRGTTIPDHQTFVIFDQARTRGADLKMDGEIVAALSLGPKLTKDSFMQAAGRLRKLGRNQQLIIMATHEVFSYIPQIPKEFNLIQQKINKTKTNEIVLKIIAWCCLNSIQQNYGLMLQFANLGWKYIHSKVKYEAFQQQISNDLKIMYEQPLEINTIAILNQRNYEIKQDQLKNHPSALFICEVLNKYGKNVKKQGGCLDDVCERQVEAQKENEKYQENALNKLNPIKQQENPKIIGQVAFLPLLFDAKFKMTANFIQTTFLEYDPAHKNINEIPELYFIKITNNQMQAISLREASKFIQKFVINKQEGNQKIYMLDELSIDHQQIKDKLETALVNAKFLAGVQNYSPEEEDHLLDIFIKTIKGIDNWKDEYVNLVAMLLKLKRIYMKKYIGSTLEKMITRINNELTISQELNQKKAIKA